MNYRRIQAWSLMIATFPLLAACSSSKGILPEVYDGRKIQQNKAVIAAYTDAQQIIGKEKEDYFPTHMPDYYSQPSLSFLEEEPVELTTDPKVVGMDIPEGRYVIEVPEYAPGSNFIIKDGEDNTIFQVVLGFLNNSIELNLYASQSISIVGREDSLLIATSDVAASRRVEKNGTFTLSDGIWKVGEHLPAGSYLLSRPLTVGRDIPYFYIIQENGTYQVFELLTDFNIPGGIDIQIKLADKQTLYIEKSQTLSFTPIEE